ncbi:hypothetical protein [Azospirillum palustre]
MADFITLTGKNGFKPRVNVDHITSCAWNEEKQITAVDLSDGTYSVTETPEQIDALLGVTDKPVIDELASAVKLVRSIIKDGAEVGFNFQHGDWAERLFASQAVTHRALAKAVA